MKKLIKSLIILIAFISLVPTAKAISFEEGFNASDTKPMLVLVHANWAENVQDYIGAFSTVGQTFQDKFNYVLLNIASSDTKFFNEKYHIYPNLPYVLFFRDNGRVTRYIPRDCAKDSACMIPKIKGFIQ